MVTCPTCNNPACKILGKHITPMEMNVLAEVTKGLSNKTIANLYNISEQTIKNHVLSLMRKFDASSRTMLAVKALKMGIA